MALGPPNMAQTVRRFSYPVARWRYPTAGVANADGFIVQPTPVESTISAHIAPAPGRVVELLPPGHTGKRTVVVYTADELQVADDETQIHGDVIVHAGIAFLVIKRGSWTGGSVGGATYRDHVAVEVRDAPGVVP